MAAKDVKCLVVIQGCKALKLWFCILVYGFWEFFVAFSKFLWKNGRNPSGPDPACQIIDSSIGTHYYIQVLGVKYHFVESGPSSGQIVCLIKDAPGGDSSLNHVELSNKLSSSNCRVISINLRGMAGSESGSRRELMPPRAMTELRALLVTLGVSSNNPVTIVGSGIGGLIAWYFVHCNSDIVKKFAIISAPHPNLYWTYPPTKYCKRLMHFIQWEGVAEYWLCRVSKMKRVDSSNVQWAGWRARDWTAPLNYIRGAAWYGINENARISCPGLLAGSDGNALIKSAVYCTSPSIRLITKDINTNEMVAHFICDGYHKLVDNAHQAASNGNIVNRVLSAVARRAWLPNE